MKMNRVAGKLNVVLKTCHRSKLEESKMFNYLILSSIIGLIIQSSVHGSKLNYSTRTKNANREETNNYGFLYKDWGGDGISTSENEITNSRVSDTHKSQQDYVCGRASTLR